MKYKIIRFENGSVSYCLMSEKVSGDVIGIASTHEQAQAMVETNMFSVKVRLAAYLHGLKLWDYLDRERAKAIAKDVNFALVN